MKTYLFRKTHKHANGLQETTHLRAVAAINPDVARARLGTENKNEWWLIAAGEPGALWSETRTLPKPVVIDQERESALPMTGRLQLCVGVRVFTKDGRRYGNGIITDHQGEDPKGDPAELYMIETDFGNKTGWLTPDEILGLWHIMDRDGLQRIDTDGSWHADREALRHSDSPFDGPPEEWDAAHDADDWTPEVGGKAIFTSKYDIGEPHLVTVGKSDGDRWEVRSLDGTIPIMADRSELSAPPAESDWKPEEGKPARFTSDKSGSTLNGIVTILERTGPDKWKCLFPDYFVGWIEVHTSELSAPPAEPDWTPEVGKPALFTCRQPDNCGCGVVGAEVMVERVNVSGTFGVRGIRDRRLIATALASELSAPPSA